VEWKTGLGIDGGKKIFYTYNRGEKARQGFFTGPGFTARRRAASPGSALGTERNPFESISGKKAF
jgi:hypothetical protein